MFIGNAASVERGLLNRRVKKVAGEIFEIKPGQKSRDQHSIWCWSGEPPQSAVADSGEGCTG